MSYARTNGIDSEVYVYASVHGGYHCSVQAQQLKEGTEPYEFPEEDKIYYEVDKSSFGLTQKGAERYAAYLDSVWEPFAHKRAGESFSCNTAGEMYRYLFDLNADGVKVPDRCFERLAEDMKHETQNS